MQFLTDIPDADLAALSAQFAARWPLTEGETTADHVTRAVEALLSEELVAARKGAADQVILAAESAKDDTAWASALLARQKIA